MQIEISQTSAAICFHDDHGNWTARPHNVTSDIAGDMDIIVPINPTEEQLETILAGLNEGTISIDELLDGENLERWVKHALYPRNHPLTMACGGIQSCLQG